MTTKFLENIICTFEILLSWRLPRKAAFLDDFPLCPKAPPQKQTQIFIFIVVSPSLILIGSDNSAQSFSGRNTLGRTPKGAYSPRGRTRHLLETPFSEPLLRTLLRTLSYCVEPICSPAISEIRGCLEKDVWEFQAKSGSSGSCRLSLHFLGKIAVQKMSGKTPGSPRRPSSTRHPRPSDI